jgi:hypothetical protein
MRVRLAKENERTVIFGVVANGHRFRRASATWLEARAALAQITNLNAEKDKELSFRKEGNGSSIVRKAWP